MCPPAEALPGAPLAGGRQPRRRRPARGRARALRAVVEDDEIWRALLARHLQPVLTAFFGGLPPPPRAGRSWKVHFFEFRVTWKRLVQEKTGRMLIQVGAQLPCGRGPNETISLWALLERAETPQTY